MRKAFLIFLLLIPLTLNSQTSFEFSDFSIKWKNPSAEYVYLRVDFKIKNIGNKSEYVEELLYMLLLCKPDYLNNLITLNDYDVYILSTLKPQEFILTYLEFKVPRNADSLTLLFPDKHGGSIKYLTESYNKIRRKYSDEIMSDGDYYFARSEYESALTKYKFGESEYSEFKNEYRQKIFNTYVAYGDKYYNTGNNIVAVKHYKSALEYVSDNEIKKKIAGIYKLIGDEYYSSKLYKNALENYNLSLNYYYDIYVANKKESCRKFLEEKIKERKISETKHYEFMKLYYPTTQIILTGGLMNKENKNTSKNLQCYDFEFSLNTKIYRISTFSFLFGCDIGLSNMISQKNSDDIYKFYNINDSIYEFSSGSVHGDFYVDAGFGMNVTTRYFVPFILFKYSIVKPFNVTLSKKNGYSRIESTGMIGRGFRFDLGLQIGYESGFYISYTFKRYYVTGSSISYLNNYYNVNMISVGFSAWVPRF